jgi:V/A-type H+-transporting ATPase subunit I
MELTNIIQVFADIMSYLRLYALGLASAMMAVTFNQIAVSAGVIMAIPVLVIGHTANIALSIMSGVIHGLRLNFLEWYRWSFAGGGKMLSPLKLMKSS